MCCLSFRNCCRCRGITPSPVPPIPPTPEVPIVNVGARFNLLSSTAVASGSAIPLTNTVFNNATSYIINNNGSISLAGEGLYLINYGIAINNNSDATSTVTVGVNVNGASDASASGVGIIPAGATGTVSNSTLIYVPQNSTSNFSLILTSDEAVSVLPNVVITKLS